MASTVQINDLKVRLFVKSDIGPDLMSIAYHKFRQQGILKTLFYEGVPADVVAFLNLWKDAVVLGCFVEDLQENTTNLAGLVWAYGVRSLNGVKRGEVGMAFFKEFQRNGIPLELADQAIDFAFHELKFDILYGTTPEPNREARLFLRKLGFKVYGVAPMFATWNGAPCDCYLSAMTNSGWVIRGLDRIDEILREESET